MIVLCGALAWDCTVLPAIYRQFRSGSFPHTQGRITYSRINGPHRGGSYNVDLAYTYTVGNRDYSGTTVRFPEGFAKSYAEAQAIVADWPTSASVTVYYDARRPATSVLSPGLDSDDYSLLLLLLPFSLILCAVLVVVLVVVTTWLRMRIGTQRSHPEKLDQRVRRVFLSRPALVVAHGGVVSGFAAFLSYDVIVVIFVRHPRAPVVLSAWVMVLLAGVVAGVRESRRRLSSPLQAGRRGR